MREAIEGMVSQMYSLMIDELFLQVRGLLVSLASLLWQQPADHRARCMLHVQR